MTYNDALTKVRHLLNKTTENGCTEAEARAAAGMAQKLMLKYQIASLDLDTDEKVESWADPLDVMPKQTKQNWRGQLAMVICRHNGCTVFWSMGQRPTLQIVGRASDVTTTRYLYQFCVREIERLRRQYRGNGRTWINNYRLGVIDGIAVSLREAREAARQEHAQETGTSLMVVDQALATLDARRAEAERFAQRQFNLRRGGSNFGRNDHGARATGQRDGRKINVNPSGPALGSGQRRLR